MQKLAWIFILFFWCWRLNPELQPWAASSLPFLALLGMPVMLPARQATCTYLLLVFGVWVIFCPDGKIWWALRKMGLFWFQKFAYKSDFMILPFQMSFWYITPVILGKFVWRSLKIYLCCSHGWVTVPKVVGRPNTVIFICAALTWECTCFFEVDSRPNLALCTVYGPSFSESQGLIH